MNIELRRRIDPLPFRMSSGVNDNAEERQDCRPRRQVIIFKPAKSAMTSGRARARHWLLEFEPLSAPFIEPLMGWTGSTDPLGHMQLAFGSREAAIAYADRHGLAYEVRERAQPGRLRDSVESADEPNLPAAAASVMIDLAA